MLGAGAWGTALAVHLARRADIRVRLWARDPRQAEAMAVARTNARYLPGIGFPPSVAVTADLQAAGEADFLVLATPMAAIAELVEALR